MYDLNELIKMWEVDSAIDQNNLANESLKSAVLHQKYFATYVTVKQRLIKYNADMGELKRLKIRYYRGEMTQDELSDNGWTQWRYNKVIKSDMDDTLAGDQDIIKMRVKIEHCELIVEAVNIILNQIKSRGWDIKNAIEYMKFKAGV